MKEIENPCECCLEMLKSIRRGKPNWPLVFFDALIFQRPDLLQAQGLERASLNKSKFFFHSLSVLRHGIFLLSLKYRLQEYAI